MLRQTNKNLAVQSHQHTPTRVPQFASGYGRNYNRNFVKNAFGGWGLGTYSAPKDRRFIPPSFGRYWSQTQEERNDFSKPTSQTTKTLSPHFRPFALRDGGVLFVHPSSKEILTWTHEVLGKENEKAKLGSVHDESRAKIQALIADNTIEHVSISHWRQMHIQRLLRRSMSRNTEYNNTHTNYSRQ